MLRGILAGMLTGAVVGAAGLAGLSLVMPLPQRPAAPQVAHSEAPPDAPALAASESALPPPAAPAPDLPGADLPAPVAATAPEPAPAEPAADGAETAEALPGVSDAGSADETADTEPTEPAPELARLSDAAPLLRPEAAPLPLAPAPQAALLSPPSDPGLAPPEPAAGSDRADPPPSAPPPLAVPERPAAPAPSEDDKAHAEAGTEPVGAAQADAGAPRSEGEGGLPRRIEPNQGLSGAVEGVRADRLPRIGDPAAATARLAEGARALTSPGALELNRKSFANPLNRPPFAVLLLDEGKVALTDLPTLAASGLPLTLVLDPAAPEAGERARIWRAAGQEVALLATGVASGATETDGEVVMEALARAVPEALALVSPPGGGALQRERSAAAAVVPALKMRGYGLVTWDEGLNAGDQVARREGLPAAVIFRDLNGRDESGPVMLRYLDRAAFKAQQDGRAVVFARLEPATLETLLSWSLTARAASLALAPLSAVLK